MGSANEQRTSRSADGRRATVSQLVEMMNRRPDVRASFVDDPEVRRLLGGAEGGHMFMIVEGRLRSYIDLDPDRATRATVFHEWLHRYFATRGVQFESIEVEHRAIEGFLRRHRHLLGLD
jgi:hypothetical protein